MVEIRSKFERVRGVKSLGQSRSAWYISRQKAAWVTLEIGDGRGEEPRHDVPQGVCVKNRCEAELIQSASRMGVKNPGVFCCTARWRGMVAVHRFLSSAQNKTTGNNKEETREETREIENEARKVMPGYLVRKSFR